MSSSDRHCTLPRIPVMYPSGEPWTQNVSTWIARDFSSNVYTPCSKPETFWNHLLTVTKSYAAKSMWIYYLLYVIQFKLEEPKYIFQT
jgi:hypothetical protein